MTDASVIDQLATAMIGPAVGTSPDVIGAAVREQTVATVKDLKRPCDQDRTIAPQIGPNCTRPGTVSLPPSVETTM